MIEIGFKEIIIFIMLCFIIYQWIFNFTFLGLNSQIEVYQENIKKLKQKKIRLKKLKNEILEIKVAFENLILFRK